MARKQSTRKKKSSPGKSASRSKKSGNRKKSNTRSKRQTSRSSKKSSSSSRKRTRLSSGRTKRRRSSRVEPGTNLKTKHRKHEEEDSFDDDDPFAHLDANSKSDYTPEEYDDLEQDLSDWEGHPDIGGRFDDDPYDHLEEQEAGAVMSIGDHLEELRKRLMGMIAVTLVVAIGLGFFSEAAHIYLVGAFKAVAPDHSLNMASGYGGFLTLIKISIIGALIITFPINLSILWGFITPAVSRKGGWLGYLVVYASTLLFWAGLAVCWFFIYPMALEFMFGTFLLPDTVPMHPVEEYYGFLFMIHIGSGLVFQLPLVIVILGALGIMDMSWHARLWKGIVVGIFVVSAIITPPDPVTQVIMGAMLILLYGSSVLIVWLIEKARRKKYAIEE